MSRPPSLGRGLGAAAFLWGLAEATFFFVVPDVLLSFVAQRRGARPAILATLWAALGACLGGAAMWALGARDPAGMASFLDGLPAISPAMIAEAGAALADDPIAALLSGAFSGVPYKVFAVQAAGAGVSAPALLAISVPTRLARFALAVLATVLAERIGARFFPAKARTGLLVGFWVLFYATFWSLMPN